MDEALFYVGKIINSVKVCSIPLNKLCLLSKIICGLFQILKLHQSGAELLIENSNDSLEKSFYNFICIQHIVLVSNN